MRLLVTRPEPEAQRTAAALRALGHDVLVMPMLRIEVVADADLGIGPFGALVITSANGARAIAGHRRRHELISLPVFVVGRRTGDAARAAGFDQVTSADGDAAVLAQVVIKHLSPPPAPLLYLTGEDHTGEIEASLARHGFSVRTVIVYRAIAAASLSQQVEAALRGDEIDGALHFSQRSVQALLTAGKAAGLLDNIMRMRNYCLSAQVAAALQDTATGAIGVAERPDEESLIALVGPSRH